MPVPHDYYDYDSDVPYLHNRDHARPYVEPDWQAHAAGHQLPVLSTIGRGPQGDGLLVANIVNDGRSFSFDIVSDVTGEPIAKIGPVPSGAVHVTHDEDSITFTTNKLGPNNTIATEVTKVDMPKGEAGSIVYLYPDQLERNSSDVYVLDAEKMVAYNRRGLNRRPDMKVDDIVIGQLKDGNDGYLFFGTVVNADSQQAIMVAGQTFIPIAALMGPRGPKGETGDKGDPGEKGDDGAPGVSPVCSWNGTVLTITDGTGPHSMDLKGETGQTGQTGADGKSAYQVAVDNGYRGSQADWLTDLKGPKGDNGAPGATGPTGPQGPAGVEIREVVSSDITVNPGEDWYLVMKSCPSVSGKTPIGVVGWLMKSQTGSCRIASGELYIRSSDNYLVNRLHITNTTSPQSDITVRIEYRILYASTQE